MPVLILAREGQVSDPEWRGQQRCKPWLQHRLDPSDRRRVQRAAEGDVELELLHHVRIAPAQQKGVLRGRQPGGAAAAQILLAGRRAEGIEMLDRAGGKPFEAARIAHRGQGEERPDPAEAKAIHRDRGFGGAERGEAPPPARRGSDPRQGGRAA